MAKFQRRPFIRRRSAAISKLLTITPVPGFSPRQAVDNPPLTPFVPLVFVFFLQMRRLTRQRRTARAVICYKMLTTERASYVQEESLPWSDARRTMPPPPSILAKGRRLGTHRGVVASSPRYP